MIITKAMVCEKGRRRQTLEALDRDRLTFQVSRDSAAPAFHDGPPGAGFSARALARIGLAKQLAFLVRVADTLGEEFGLIEPKPTIDVDGTWWHPVAVTKQLFEDRRPTVAAGSCSGCDP